MLWIILALLIMIIAGRAVRSAAQKARDEQND
jgi:hypothetical protein